MEDNPKEDSNKEQPNASSPSGDTPPLVDGGNKPGDKYPTATQKGGGTNEPPRQNNNLTEPDGSDGKKKKWPRDDRFKLWTLIIGGLGLVGTIWALTNTTNTLNANRNEFEISNRPFIELSDIKIDSFGAGKKPILYYNLTNKGRFPALITSVKAYFGFSAVNTSADTIIAFNKRVQPTNIDSTIGIIPFSPAVYQTRAESQVPLLQDVWSAINARQSAFNLVVEIKYSNLVTKSHYSYLQVLKIGVSPTLNSTSIKYHDDPDSSK
jgi:hypothetical protein